MNAGMNIAANNSMNLSNSMNNTNSANLLPLNNGNNSTTTTAQFINATNCGTGLLNNSISTQAQQSSQQQQQTVQQSHEISQDDLRYHGVELVVLYDYKAQAPDDLSVRRGEIIYADLNNQTVDGWLWCYKEKNVNSKKCGKYGFIPKSYTHTYNRQNTSV